MRVKITYTSYFDLDLEDFEEINDEGKRAILPKEKILELVKEEDHLADYLLDSLSSDYHVDLEEL